MSIDFDKFLDWAESRFDEVIVKGDEIKVNSIFCDDEKHHLWCNPYGGKYSRPNGVFHCWKSDRSGSLLSLVMLVDTCEYEEALEILGGSNTTFLELERKVRKLFEDKDREEAQVQESKLKLPDYTYPIADLHSTNYHRVQAEMYLFQRALPTDRHMVCIAGEFKNRIVIPYYDRNGELIYFNSRYIGTSKKALRYRGPDKEVGVGKGDVIYVPDWPQEGSKIYLSEGEFDADSIRVCGLPAGAFGGKALSPQQIEYLVPYKPVICVDCDPAGKEALPKMGDDLLRAGVSEVSFVRPPKGYKDWNVMLKKLGPEILFQYIKNKEKSFHDWYSIKLGFQSL